MSQHTITVKHLNLSRKQKGHVMHLFDQVCVRVSRCYFTARTLRAWRFRTANCLISLTLTKDVTSIVSTAGEQHDRPNVHLSPLSVSNREMRFC